MAPIILHNADSIHSGKPMSIQQAEFPVSGNALLACMIQILTWSIDSAKGVGGAC
jgi:hypothetical protein